MKLKLIESIRCNGVQYLPPAVIDCAEIGISDLEAEILVRRGTAALHVAEPEVLDEAPVESADVVFAGAVAEDGTVTAAADLPAEVVAAAEPEAEAGRGRRKR